jgi:hypothetical protein
MKPSGLSMPTVAQYAHPAKDKDYLSDVTAMVSKYLLIDAASGSNESLPF